MAQRCGRDPYSSGLLIVRHCVDVHVLFGCNGKNLKYGTPATPAGSDMPLSRTPGLYPARFGGLATGGGLFCL
jgi:hypothetical protein